VFDEELTMVVASGGQGHIKSGRMTIPVFRSGCAYRAHLEEWLKRTGQVPYRVMEMAIEAILGCVAAGMGASFLPRSVVNLPRYAGAIKCLTLPPEVVTVVIWFARRKSGQERIAMENFRDMITMPPIG